MRTRIGVAVSHRFIRAVAVRQGRVVWAGEAPWAEPDALAPAIDTLLRQAALPRWPRPLLSSAIGPHGAQIKRITGLPAASDAATLAAIIREGLGTFFLKNGKALLTTGIRAVEPGAVVAAVIEQSVVDALYAVCRTRGFRPGSVAPTAVALTRALSDSTFQWHDDGLTVEVRRDANGVESVRTRPGQADDATPLTPVAALANLGADVAKYADAYGAAALDLSEPVAVHYDPSRWRRLVAARQPFILAGLLLVFSLASVALSPLAAVWAGKHSAARTAQMRPGRWQVITGALEQLEQVSAVLQDAQSFAASRSGASALLAELTRLLPEGSALLALDWSGDRGEVVVLTTNPGRTLAAFRRLPSVASAELVGSVATQSTGGREFQRVTIRFVMGTARR